ncbi:MAG TPA: hypothetical protein VM032_07135 [Vicinamibacterales bacterium]|nr:hypothetical protein [Vicinamibacterales bacterium]
MEMSRNSRWLVLCVLAVLVVTAPACAAVEGIFKAGMWVGVVMVVLVLGLVLFVVSRFTSR